MIRITFCMAPPLFHSFLKKGYINQVNKFLYYFISNEKVVVPYGNFSEVGSIHTLINYSSS